MIEPAPRPITKIATWMVVDVKQAQADFDDAHGLAAMGHPAAMPSFVLRLMDQNARVLGLVVPDHEHPHDATDDWFDAMLAGPPDLNPTG